MTVIHSVEEFDTIIKEGKVLVDFFANWCGPCKMLAPVLEEVSEQVDSKIVKVDVDELPELARRFGIFSIPTLLLFENGQLVRKQSGYLNADDLIDFIG